MFDSKNSLLLLESRAENKDFPEISATLGKAVLVTKVELNQDSGEVSLQILTDCNKSPEYRMADSLIDLVEQRYQECRYLCERAVHLASEAMSMIGSGDIEVGALHRMVSEYEAIKNESKRQLI